MPKRGGKSWRKPTKSIEKHAVEDDNDELWKSDNKLCETPCITNLNTLPSTDSLPNYTVHLEASSNISETTNIPYSSSTAFDDFHSRVEHLPQ